MDDRICNRRTAMHRRMISHGFVDDALDCLTARGIDPFRALEGTGISHPVTSDVTNVDFGALWLNIARLMGDEFFGQAKRSMRPGSFKILCHAVLHARTLEQAAKRALTFLEIVLEDPAGDLVRRDGRAEIVLRDGGYPLRPAFAYRTFWLILLGVFCWLIGRRIALLRIDFSCPAPENRSDYREFFGAPVHFDQPASSLAFDAKYLSLPTIRDERSLSGFLRGAPANILLRYRHDQGVSARIRRRLAQTEPETWPGFDDLAADMGLSPATLRRRLRAEGQGFIAIRDEVRYSRAQDMLRNEDRSIAEIATAIGYAEPSAFHRAFLKWSGVSPAIFRDREILSLSSG
jgi:AraC-like DNA-binding protein